SIADTLQIFGLGEEKDNHENDAACMTALIRDLDRHREGNVFVVFLESTHFGYSWPQNENYNPAPATMDYLKLTCSNEQIEGVKSRYRNATHFIDGLFGKFFEKMKSLPTNKESVVVITGDHGEEFFEEGRIFHASNLSSMQTHVPIYYRLGSKSVNGGENLSSHLDIFPTLLHHVFGKDLFEHWFDGESILRPRKKHFAITTRINWSRDPYEFLIYTGENQLIVRFANRSNISKSPTLQIVSYRDKNGAPLKIDVDQIREQFKEALDSLFITD
ncbi:MAG: sulfatase-like hydrolase/transferase, partial [Thermodesulfobacteriota bacterium]